MVAGVPALNRLAEPGVVEGPFGSAMGGADPSRDRRGSCRGGGPAVSVVMTVHGSEGAVLINGQWEG